MTDQEFAVHWKTNEIRTVIFSESLIGAICSRGALANPKMFKKKFAELLREIEKIALQLLSDLVRLDCWR